MTVKTRLISDPALPGLSGFGAVRTEQGVRLACHMGITPEQVRAACGDTLIAVRQIGRSMIALLDPSSELGDPPELDLLADRNVLVAVRNGETPEATAAWLEDHMRLGADAALIFDRDPPEDARFAAPLTDLAPDIPIVVVNAARPAGRTDAPDARHPALAPAAPTRDPPKADPWHAPLVEVTLFELLRHRFLAHARAVAFLDIGDLLRSDVSVFDQAVAAQGQVVLLRGVETYPWRLRQDRPAPHGDHIATRRGERRRLLSWAAAPASLPPEAIWKPGPPPRGVPSASGEPVAFHRAMGVVFPGIAVNRLVRKADLVEDPLLVADMTDRFGVAPIRLPAPGQIPPRPASNSVTVVTAMKNEGPFILDWIAHNRVIGIARHLVYTNDCEDGTERLLDLLADAGVTRRDNPFRETGNVPQYAAFRAAEAEPVVTEADWLLTLDVDEYVNIHVGDGHVADLLAALPEAHVISMPWRLFGNADIARFVDLPVTEQFTRCAPAFAPSPLHAWAFKSLFRNEGLFRRLGVHRPKGLHAGYHDGLNWVAGSGKPLPPSVWRSAWRMSKSSWGYDLASINHYAVRSAESFLVKRERGRVNHTTRDQGLAYWFRMNHNAEEERSIARLAGSVAAEKARLLALPGVAEAHAAAVGWHQVRIAALLAQSEPAQLFDEITSPRMQNLSRLSTRFGGVFHLEGPERIPDEIAMRDPDGAPFFYTGQ